jgi:hypothetical protein
VETTSVVDLVVCDQAVYPMAYETFADVAEDLPRFIAHADY